MYRTVPGQTCPTDLSVPGGGRRTPQTRLWSRGVRPWRGRWTGSNRRLCGVSHSVFAGSSGLCGSSTVGTCTSYVFAFSYTPPVIRAQVEVARVSTCSKEDTPSRRHAATPHSHATITLSARCSAPSLVETPRIRWLSTHPLSMNPSKHPRTGCRMNLTPARLHRCSAHWQAWMTYEQACFVARSPDRSDI